VSITDASYLYKKTSTMKKSRLQELAGLQERNVWKSAEYEEMSSAIDTIEDLIYVFDELQQRQIQPMLDELRRLVNAEGTMKRF
jgi:phosphoglycerate-specific signal transduction histidine kinase